MIKQFLKNTAFAVNHSHLFTFIALFLNIIKLVDNKRLMESYSHHSHHSHLLYILTHVCVHVHELYRKKGVNAVNDGNYKDLIIS